MRKNGYAEWPMLKDVPKKQACGVPNSKKTFSGKHTMVTLEFTLEVYRTTVASHFFELELSKQVILMRLLKWSTPEMTF